MLARTSAGLQARYVKQNYLAKRRPRLITKDQIIAGFSGEGSFSKPPRKGEGGRSVPKPALPLFVASLLSATVCTVCRAAEIQAAGTAENWVHHGGGVDESGYSRLQQINTANVGKLGLSSYLNLDGEVTLEATPLAVDATVYFTGSSGTIYAADAVTGRLFWKHDPEIWKYSPVKQRYNFGSNRGVGYADGRIFSGVLDGRLIALDAVTGQLLWSVDTVPPDDYHTVNGAPLVFRGKVLIGNGGADANMRGYVTAYDQETGQQLWRFYTTPGSPAEYKGDPAMERAAATWGKSEYWKTGTGGTVWNGLTYDPELNSIYIGTGNASPYDPRVRDPGGGDNLYTCSIVALDADTGKYLWHYQYNPREAWDYKATANMIYTTLTLDGEPRRVVMQAPTNGFFYVIDRETGKLISAEKTGKATWAKRIDLGTGRPIEEPNIRYETGETIMYPGALGTHNWQDMSFNPKTGLVYIPYMQLGMRYSVKVGPADLSIGAISLSPNREDTDDGKGALLAWDPVQQKARWRVPLDTIWNGGTLTTAGNLVFQGTGDGFLSAYEATTGERLWRFNAGLGIVGAPISYSVNGKQYVSVLVGYGGATSTLKSIFNIGWKYGAQKRRLLTFTLDGKEVLPPSPPPDLKVHAVDNPTIKLEDAAIVQGHALSIACFACHGPAFNGTGSPGPDLRESKLALSEDAVWSVLHDGALMQRGMPRFDMFTRDHVHELYMYIRAAAREALGTGKPVQKILEDAESHPASQKSLHYSTGETNIGLLLDDPATRDIVDRYIRGFSKRSQITLLRSMTLKQVQFHDRAITDEILAKIDADLARLSQKR
jgi:quinohemoprotein ethanol dehydrogenase